MATVSIPAGTSALLLDIEGTTTPITFVKVNYITLTHVFSTPREFNSIVGELNSVKSIAQAAAMLADACHHEQPAKPALHDGVQFSGNHTSV